MRHLWHWAMAGALVVTLVHPGSTALADDLPAPVLGSYNDFGNTGLLQMPNARMAPDGEFAIGSSYVWPYTRYYVTSQFLPWLQGTFRFTSIANRDYGPASKTGQSYKDKGVDVKVRLVPEGPYTPEISAGLRDVGGTGLFSSEYVAMSRRYYDFDFTLGMAWGNAGTRGDFSNPLGLAADSFKSRQASSSTGAFNNNYFRGESVALFGGIEYRTPIEGLRLKLELDGNNYQEEPQEGEFNVASRLNVGAEYQPWSWLNLGLGLERGNKAMFRLTLKSNPSTDMGVPKLIVK